MKHRWKTTTSTIVAALSALASTGVGYAQDHGADAKSGSGDRASRAMRPAPPPPPRFERTVLPVPAVPFSGTVAENALDAKPGNPLRVTAPEGAPNVLLFMSDDVGFSMSSAFGGPVPTPNFERLARKGQRYNRFHTTGICSPSRAALLTGRNHHKAGVGWLSDLSAPYPGYGGRIRPETATIAQVLRLNGYNTAMFGKHHNVPAQERSTAGPFDAWPTGLGFEYFYGFPFGDIDQYSPNLYRGISPVPAQEEGGKLVDERLADDLIHWVHNQKAGAPEKPFLAYLAPGSTHAPHQVPGAWIERFRGQFDKGWDAIRVETWRRQIAAGIIPADTRLTERPGDIPAWDSLSPEEQAFHARSMEVAAAQLAFQDAQFGRVLDELERMGELDNTLVAVVMGDNGASGEAGPRGTINELRSMGTHDEREAFLLSSIDKLGGPDSYGNYSVGWAWAMNAPLRWVKQYASMLGGVRNGMILSWGDRASAPGAVCGRFSHLTDIVPTVLEATGLPAPDRVLGSEQEAIDGKSLLSSFENCDAAMARTQYFEIGGKMALYHDGWFLSGEDGRVSWQNMPPDGPNPDVNWTLYDLSKDFSQSRDLSQEKPEKLAEMKALFRKEAQANNVYPIDHRFGMARAMSLMRPSGRKHFEYWGKNISVPTNVEPVLMARPYTLSAELDLASPGASGVVVALGSKFGGWSLYLDKGRPAFKWSRSTDPVEQQGGVAQTALPAGKNTLTMRFSTQKPGGPATVTLSSGEREYLSVDLPRNYLQPAGNGENLDIGYDLGVPVTTYQTPQGRIEGDIDKVTVDFD